MSASFFKFDSQGGPRRILALAWPILIGQWAVVANGVIDTAMTSRFSAIDLAALALGSSIYISVFVGATGVLQALAPIIGQLFGANRLDQIGATLKQAAWLVLFLSLAGCLVLLFPQFLLQLAEPSPHLLSKASWYLQILALALPATLGFRLYSGLNTALSRPKMVMAIQIAALLLKFPLNAWFIFGGLGIPAMGGPGSAMATAVLAWLTLLVSWLLLRHGEFYKAFRVFGSGWVWPDWRAQFELLRLGIPIGMSYLIEVTAFTFMALFIARFGEQAIAGHQITANFGTVLYMIPLSIATATGTLVAQYIGADDMPAARRMGYSGIWLGALLCGALGIVIWLLRLPIIHAYSPDPSIIASASPLFLFIAFYQVFDAIQVNAAFVLRAYKITLVPTLVYAIALWGIGLGGGALLGLNPFGWAPPALQGAPGFWFGNSVSIACAALGLMLYLRHIQRRAGTSAPALDSMPPHK